MLTSLEDEIQRRFVWVGGVTSSSAVFSIRLGAASAELLISRRSDLAQPMLLQPVAGDVHGQHRPDPSHVVKVNISLPSATQLYYRVQLTSIILTDNSIEIPAKKASSDTVVMDREYVRVTFSSPVTMGQGKFRTFPTVAESSSGFSFKVGIGSCAWSGSNSIAFTRMVDLDLDVVLHLGDMHYEDIVENKVSRFDAAFEMTFRSLPYRRMLTNQPVAYVWDDHDFGPNDADATSPAKVSARVAYAKNVPHYPLVAATSSSVPNDRAIYHSFEVGRVLFIMTDLVSEALPGLQRFSKMQEQWLLKHLKLGRDNYKLTIWASSKPWIGPSSSTADSWLGHSDSRKRLSNFIAQENITNLIVVSGDAHMLAIDDGTNTDYSDVDGAAGFPIFQTAPFDRIGSTKGGPFSHGCYAYRWHDNYHFGLLKVDDNEQRTCVHMEAIDARKDDPVITFSTCVPTVKQGNQGGGLGSCPIPKLPDVELGLVISALVMLLLYSVTLVFRSHCCTTRFSFAARRSCQFWQVFAIALWIIGVIPVAILSSTAVYFVHAPLWILFAVSAIPWIVVTARDGIRSRSDTAGIKAH